MCCNFAIYLFKEVNCKFMLNFICNLRSILKFITFNLIKQKRKVEKMRLKIDKKSPKILGICGNFVMLCDDSFVLMVRCGLASRDY